MSTPLALFSTEYFEELAPLRCEGPVLDEPMGHGLTAIARRAVRAAARAALHEVLGRAQGQAPSVSQPRGLRIARCGHSISGQGTPCTCQAQELASSGPGFPQAVSFG
jgi:hypothetical protein